MAAVRQALERGHWPAWCLGVGLAVTSAFTACTFPDFDVTLPGAGGSTGGDLGSGAVAGDNALVGGAGAEPCAASGACGGAPASADGGAPPRSIDDIDGLLLGYAFDDVSTTFLDSSGNELAGRVGSFAWAPGIRGHALSLDGAYGFVSLPTTGVTDGLLDFSVTLWVRPKSLPSWSRLFDFGTGPAAFVTLIAATSTTGAPRFSLKTSGSETLVVESSAPLALDTWQHVGVTQSGDDASVYIDGALVGSSSSFTQRADAISSTLNYLGRSQFSADPAFDGAFDELRVYSRALSSSEIQSVARGATVAGGLFLSYDFDETSGDVVPEASHDASFDAQVATGVTFVPGQLGTALELDGAAGYVDLPANVLSGLESFTIACFVKQESLRNSARLFDFGDDAENYIALMPNANSSQRLRFGARFAGGTEQVLDTVPLELGVWEHVAVTRAGASIRIYAGGQEVGSRLVQGFPADFTSSSNWLGRSHHGDPLLNAALDDFRIYDRALSAAEVAALAAAR